MDYIAYYRVSTDKQGLGLEAQEQAVANYVTGHDGQVVGEYKEIETGKGSNALKKRPELAAALKECRKKKAVLIIAKLDRLARNVYFISGLIESKVNFICCDNPHANKAMIQMLAVFAEHEREIISTRTKEGLAAAKAKGVELGKHGREVLSKKNSQSAKDFAHSLIPVIEEIKSLGMTTQQSIADELTRRKIKTARGNTIWYQQNVGTLLKRINHLRRELL